MSILSVDNIMAIARLLGALAGFTNALNALVRAVRRARAATLPGSRCVETRQRRAGSQTQQRSRTVDALQASSIHAGAWSLALSSPRAHRSTPPSMSRGSSTWLTRRWSMRRPASRDQEFRK